MKSLILLFWGVVLLASMSQTYYPVNGLSYRSKRHFLRERTDPFLVIAILWMVSFSFLRTSYNDTGNYIKFFNNARPVQELLSEEGFFRFGNNPLHSLYQAFIHELTDNYHFYFLGPALLSSIAMIKLFKRYSCRLSFTCVVFFGIGTYIMYMAAIKQSLAVAILACAIPYAIDKKYVRFYLLVIVATFCHTHAFMFAFLPFLFRKPWGKLTWLMVAVIVFLMATYNSTMGVVMRVALDNGVNVADIELFDGHSINVLRVIVYWIPAVMALLFRKRLFNDATREENLFANMSIIAALILSIGLVQGANLFARMAAYFEFAIAISLPWMIEKVFNKKSAKFIKTAAVILFFGYFYYEFAISKGFDSSYGGYRAITWWQFIESLFA